MSPENPAEMLRRAAAQMREGAGKATPGPWTHMCLGSEGCLVLRAEGTIRERGHGRVARFGQKDWQGDHADATFVAAMNPVVALAVADLLERAAGDAELALMPSLHCRRCGGRLEDDDPEQRCCCWIEPLAVARAYLGESS
jgi:hypothetical protein